MYSFKIFKDKMYITKGFKYGGTGMCVEFDKLSSKQLNDLVHVFRNKLIERECNVKRI